MSDPQPAVADELARRINTACEQFEQSWRSGLRPRIEDYLNLFQASERPVVLDSISKLQNRLILSDLPASSARSASPGPAADHTINIPASTVSASAFEERDSSRSQAVVSFVVTAGPHSGVTFTFRSHDTLVAGRDPDSQLLLDKDLHFSRHHFRIEVNPPTCFIMDLDSRNGTFVNGQRIKEQFLCDGDVVSGGRTQMSISVQESVKPIVKPSSGSSKPLMTKPVSTPKPPPPLPPLPQRTTSVNAAPPPQPVSLPQPASTPQVARRDPDMGEAQSSGVSIAGYAVYEELGSGDLGIVYRAKRNSDQQACALKVMTPAAHSDQTSVQAFLREGMVLRQLDHAHIIRLLEMGFSGEQIFVATEFVSTINWTSLAAQLAPDKRMTLACGLMTQILDALEFAHRKSMVHRDVKPGNILVYKEANKLKAKLADFGLAKQYSNAGMSQITTDGAVLGSLPFMSPDQFLNSREARPTCDIYSAGATLYWMLTGKEPIPTTGHACKFLAILEEAPTSIRKYNASIPSELAFLVHKSLEKTPEKRFQSAGQMRDKLRPFTK